jgi:hypothetical protein
LQNFIRVERRIIKLGPDGAGPIRKFQLDFCKL